MSTPPDLPPVSAPPELPTGNVPSSPYAPCPKCGARESRKVGFTWWGGILGPNLLTHVECPQCKTQYNGKTGRSNKNGIILYFGVCTAIGLMVLFFLFLLMILAQ